MRRVNIMMAALVALLSSSLLLAADDNVRNFQFGSDDVGKVPPGWKADKTGKGEGSVWKVVADKTAPSGKGYALAQTAEGPSSVFNEVTPVRLPPGRFKLATRPAAIGSIPFWKTIGIVAVAAFAARAARVLPGVAITATWRRTRSAASAGNRSYWLSAQRYSIAMLRPST